MSWELWVIVAVAGALGQMMDAAAGMGFGVLSSSLMVAGGVAPGAAATTVNLAKIGSGAFSGLAHWSFGNVRWQWFLPLMLWGVAGAVSGGLLLSHVPRNVVGLAVPLVLLGMSLLVLRRALFLTRSRIAGASQQASPIQPQGGVAELWNVAAVQAQKSYLGALGFLAGAINAITGGYGPFATSGVLLAKGGHPRFAIGTVNAVETFVAGASSVTLLLGAASRGFRWEMAVALMAGSFATAPIGAYLSRYLPARGLLGVVGVALLAINAWSIVRALT